MSRYDYFPGHYRPNLERITQDPHLYQYEWMIRGWLSHRQTLVKQDSDKNRMVGKHIPAEVIELLHNLNQKETPRNLKDTHTEAFDILFLILSLLINHPKTAGESIDYHSIRAQVSQLGRRSDVLDKIQDAAYAVSETQLKQDLEYVYSLCLSMFAGLPGDLNIGKITQIIDRKNSANYPVVGFDDIDHLTGKKLNPEQIDEKYAHTYPSYKLVRDALRKVMGLDRDYGLEKSDWVPFAPLILDFQHPAQAFGQLGLAVCEQFNLPYEQTIQKIQKGKKYVG